MNDALLYYLLVCSFLGQRRIIRDLLCVYSFKIPKLSPVNVFSTSLKRVDFRDKYSPEYHNDILSYLLGKILNICALM